MTEKSHLVLKNIVNHLLSVICVVFLWSVSIDKAYLNVLVVISKLLGQSILGMRQLPCMNILVLKKRLVASSNSITREKVNVIFVNKAFSVLPYYFNNQHPSKRSGSPDIPRDKVSPKNPISHTLYCIPKKFQNFIKFQIIIFFQNLRKFLS